MATFVVSRHQAAAEWMAKQGFASATVITHVDAVFWDSLKAGDVVVGTLPMHLAAKACSLTGNAFGFLSLNVPSELRGQRLTIDQMDSCKAAIEWFDVTPVAAPKVA